MIGSKERVLLDTNIVVFLVRGSDVGKRIDADHGLSKRSETPLISSVTLGEARSLGKQLTWESTKIERLHELLSKLTVVDINLEPVLEQYAEIDNFSRGSGRRMDKNDVWIAATTVAAGAVLLTTDKDFDHLHPTRLHRILVDPKTGAS